MKMIRSLVMGKVNTHQRRVEGTGGDLPLVWLVKNNGPMRDDGTELPQDLSCRHSWRTRQMDVTWLLLQLAAGIL